MECNDPRCPFHGSLKIHGYQIEGIVVSNKQKRTVIIRHEYTTFLPKYLRFLRKNSKIAAHKPDCLDVKIGDHVIIGGTRRLSKTKSFAVIKVLQKENT
ncbi:MAG: 30S ribosomal protein S17 [Candidatus Marsarchaeota archaeon]|jgi:small subunit ribosomal protein S17|nr:30S ribosomal protein S17 [Candidatus Marsarchaeota archaeon]